MMHSPIALPRTRQVALQRPSEPTANYFQKTPEKRIWSKGLSQTEQQMFRAVARSDSPGGA